MDSNPITAQPTHSRGRMDAASTPYYNALNANPLRYRGYIYDSETGFYYLQSRYYDPAVRRFINADGLIAGTGTVLGYNMYSYCFNNPVNMSDSQGNWPEWVEAVSKVVVGVSVVATTALVITGTGGTGAVLAMGVSCSALNGGYFNEKNEGGFTSGAIGGAVSGLIQGAAGIRYGIPGIIFGGSLGSGLGTFITEFLDFKFDHSNSSKTLKSMLGNSITSASVALITSAITGYANIMVDSNSNNLIAITETFSEMFKAFFSAIDDAITYIITGGGYCD